MLRAPRSAAAALVRSVRWGHAKRAGKARERKDIMFRTNQRLAGLFVAAGIGCIAASASAQDWHVSELGDSSATLPDVDNDGQGNREGRGSCSFDMEGGGDFTADLLVYSQEGMDPYSSAKIDSRGWQTLQFEGRLASYSPEIQLVNQCMNPDDPSVEEAFDSDWFPVEFDKPTPNFNCPADKPVLVQSWCRTAVMW